MILGPFFTYFKIKISLYIFEYLTGFKSFMTIFYSVSISIPSYTSLYLPLPKGYITSYLIQLLFNKLEIKNSFFIFVIIFRLSQTKLSIFFNNFISI